MSKRVYWLWLASRDDLGAGTIRRLTESFGTPEFLYGADRTQLIRAGLNKRQTDALCDKDLSGAQAILRACEEKKIQIITIEDSAYPDRLREIDDPPPVLYVRGRLPDFDRMPGITIVGTRSCSAYGLRMAERFSAALAKAGFTIISGMARGIDSAAHRGCLKADGATVAVLAGGVDLCYPPENRYLMGDIMLAGAVISENPPGTPHEGAMISARRAFDQGREVFAVPGPLDVPGSVGCNQLIRDEIARIATSPMDIVHELAPMLEEPPQEALIRKVWLRELGGYGSLPAPEPEERRVQPIRVERRGAPDPAPAPKAKPEVRQEPAKPDTDRALPDYLDGSERQVAEALAAGADTVDALSEATGLPAAEVAAALVLLELEGIAEQKAGHCRFI